MTATVADVLAGRAGWAVDCIDVLDGLAGLPDGSVSVVVTSPPYHGLRSYLTASWSGGDPDCTHAVRTPETVVKMKASSSLEGAKSTVGHQQEGYRDRCHRCGATRVDRQIGLEQKLDCAASWRNEPPCADCFVCSMRRVFAEVRRVLHPSGSLFLNLGDSYAGSWGNQGRTAGRGTQRPINGPMLQPLDDDRYPSRGSRTGSIPKGSWLKPKDLCGQPWRVAFALQADGWYLRSAITLCKVSPMPESVTDRPTSATEMLFVFAKRANYYWDKIGASAPTTSDHGSGNGFARDGRISKGAGYGQEAPWQVTPTRNLWNYLLLSPEPMAWQLCGACLRPYAPIEHRALAKHRGGEHPTRVCLCGRHDAWTSHFASFPSAIPRLAILAGSSAHGVCGACGAPWEREIERESRPNRSDNRGKHDGTLYRTVSGGVWNDGRTAIDRGWRPTCAHGRPPSPAVVLDPFAGSGTTLIEARRHGRRAIGFDLSPAYVALSRTRIESDSPMFNRPEAPSADGLMQPMFDEEASA